ncbi:binding-protein-dependent transport systems inner membrane component [Candidatus Vecturithrix granuli]|uniref:Binding-protein-dependent transport systems inner membrane component n=1 Tax=Vecturithrix granuli TaxID=1499967 RepID=A0A081BZ37_VECG1|nr:binding-protein-dependent transport systems inner membrane component [Candidatus Vecturithrix granuli]
MKKYAAHTTYWLLLPLILLLLFFFVFPLLMVFLGSFYVEGEGFTLRYYAETLFESVNVNALKNSFVLALTTTLLGVISGGILSYLIFRLGERGKNVLLSLVSVPLSFSGLVIAYAFIITFGSSGTFTLLLAKVLQQDPANLSAYLYTWKGLVLAYLYFLIPRMILTMMAAWTNLDWSLIEAAESLGAGWGRILSKVIIPAIGPSLLAGSALLFAVAMGAFGTAFALVGTGVNILPLLIYTQVSDVSYNLSLANALSVMLTVVTTLLIYGYQRMFVR